MTIHTPLEDEKAAIQKIKNKDIAGLETLVGLYQTRAIYSAYLIVRDTETAEDIVQTSFLKVYEKIHTFDDTRPFGPWFFRIVVNSAIKTAQKGKRNVRILADEELNGWVDQMIGSGSSPFETLVLQEIKERVWQALSQLSPEERGVIVMRHFLEMSDEEMMIEFGRPKTSIRWWLRTARIKLRILLLPFWQSDSSDMLQGKDTTNE
jgi:RNA polymerase sigma-70 factor, ECF subfamily